MKKNGTKSSAAKPVAKAKKKAAPAPPRIMDFLKMPSSKGCKK